MRHRETLKRHGVVRCVMKGGGVVDATYKNGVPHGLYVHVKSNDTTIKLCKDGKEQASFTFDSNFKEIKRKGSHLSELTAQWFNPTVTNL